MVGNTGTYVDVPFHRYGDGDDLAATPLDRLASLPGIIVRVTGAAERAIDWHHFVPIDCRGRAVLVHTGWWTRFQQQGDGAEPGSGLDWTCASWMHDHEIAAIAADNLMVEDPNPANGRNIPPAVFAVIDLAPPALG